MTKQEGSSAHVVDKQAKQQDEKKEPSSQAKFAFWLSIFSAFVATASLYVSWESSEYQKSLGAPTVELTSLKVLESNISFGFLNKGPRPIGEVSIGFRVFPKLDDTSKYAAASYLENPKSLFQEKMGPDEEVSFESKLHEGPDGVFSPPFQLAVHVCFSDLLENSRSRKVFVYEIEQSGEVRQVSRVDGLEYFAMMPACFVERK